MLKILDDNVATHNLGEERNVGCLNYDLSRVGTKNFESASRKVVLNKSMDMCTYFYHQNATM